MMNETLRLINARRSIRSYTDAPIPQSKKDAILNAAMRSPSAGNMMRYSIVEIEDPNTKRSLAESCDHQPFIAKAPWLLLFLADYRRWADMYEAGGAYEGDGPHRRPGVSELMLACSDALIAAQTAVIAAESLGVGSCYIGDIMENFEKHRELLSLPSLTFPIALLCLGVGKRRTDAITPRLDKQIIVHKEKYRRLDKEEIRVLIENLGKERLREGLPDGCDNFAQYIYARKFASSFAFEMERSIQVWLEDWLNAR